MHIVHQHETPKGEIHHEKQASVVQTDCRSGSPAASAGDGVLDRLCQQQHGDHLLQTPPKDAWEIWVMTMAPR